MLVPVTDPTSAWPLSPHTGEPRRPWPVVAGVSLVFAGVVVVMVGLLRAMWMSVDRFEEAAWLNRAFPTEFGDPVRAAIAAGLVAIGLVIAVTSSMTAWYAWEGYGWARWAGVVSAALSFGALTINPLASLGIVGIVAGAAVLWTPPFRRYSAAWHARRHPEVPAPDIEDEVFYGPLPRYATWE